MVTLIESLMYRISDILLAPVLIAILITFAYAWFAFGRFAMQYQQRRQHSTRFNQPHQHAQVIPGYAVFSFLAKHPGSSFDALEVFALKHLETLRLATRIAPMLGLIATMIPMGPALKSLADGNIQGISDNLVIAFSAVIFGLVAASLTYWAASVQKRWLAEELIICQRLLAQPADASHNTPELRAVAGSK
jgi:biopolymer transport protein ExbB/TolQ